MLFPSALPRRGTKVLARAGRVFAVVLVVSAVAAVGFALRDAEAHPRLAVLQQPAALNTLRIFGYPVVSNPNDPPEANGPATAGDTTVVDPFTRELPEDPPYSSAEGPFSPTAYDAPRMDFVTWNPVWISERLDDADLRAAWPGLTGIDEVSRGAVIHASGNNGSEKVWLRHWYEPQHLDKDLNSDGRLTDADNNGVPDAPANPTASSVDEWYPAIITEMTYMLTDNDPLPVRDPAPAEAYLSAPRPVCGDVGNTQFVFPVGVSEAQIDPAGPIEGYGLTSLDMDFDGTIDMVRVEDEYSLRSVTGEDIDFDGDGQLDPLDPDGLPLSCDEMVVLRSEQMVIGLGEEVQFLDHYVRLVAVTDSAAVLAIYYTGDKRPRLVQQRLVGGGASLLAGDAGPVEIIPPGGGNLGSVPRGAWFASLVDADADADTVILIVGRALGAPCASMESARPNVPTRSSGGPWFLKRFYVDGYEYNTVALMSCGTSAFQFITLRAPLPKVDAIIEQHSVRLQRSDVDARLVLPPPFNYEHTILEDVRAIGAFDNLTPPSGWPEPYVSRPAIEYMGGPIGPVPPVLGRGDTLPYTGRDPAHPVGPYTDPLAVTWRYVAEDVDQQRVGQIREKLGADRPGVVVAQCADCPRRIPEGGDTFGVTITQTDIVQACGVNGRVEDVNFAVDLEHTYLGDLDLDLISPAGTSATLFDQMCDGTQDLQAVFDDEAMGPITWADCPPLYFGTFQPSPDPLSLFDGEPGVGVWYLEITDNWARDIGRINDWAIEVTCSRSQPAFFYNEQVWTMPWHYTEFVLPNQADPAIVPAADPDKYHVTSAFTSPYARWRRWRMPDGSLSSITPPLPTDLVADYTPEGGYPLGDARRAVFWFDPDVGGKLFMDEDGVRLYGGAPERPDYDADPSRPGVQLSAGDLSAGDRYISDTAPVEVFPYTDPWAPFNSQHPHAPRADSLSFNPAYMDEFRNFDEDLRLLYSQITNGAMNAREKVYHRTWYEPAYTTKIPYVNDPSRDYRFPAVVQEYTYLYLDTTDNPTFAGTGSSRFGFPIGTRSTELPEPNTNGTLPPGGTFGYGLTTFDANFDAFPDAVTIHSEATLAGYFDAQWQSNRPRIIGNPVAPIPGPVLDFDGDGVVDAIDADGVPLNGNEMVVFAVESLALDLDPATPEGPSAMILDHLVTLDSVTPSSTARMRIWFTGGNNTSARPEMVGGVHVLDIGDAAIVDRFRNRVTIVHPGETNSGPDGAWFVFVEDVSTTDQQIVVTVGRALGATHTAIDNGAGGHDLTPGDPWYLKRFYVDGHEYNVVAVMTRANTGGLASEFQFITIRTPVPKGDFRNPQDTLFQQGYYLGGLPDEVSVLPPFNVAHTIVEDLEALGVDEFANTRTLDACVGDLAAASPLVETIVAEESEPRLGTELLELHRRDAYYSPPTPADLDWETDQVLVTPYEFTELSVPEGQRYLLTLNWTSPVSRLYFYGCTRADPGPFADFVPGLTHEELAELAEAWSPPPDIVPFPNQWSPAQPDLPVVPPGTPPVISPYYDARIGAWHSRVKLFYDPATAVDAYVGHAALAPVVAPAPTALPPVLPTAVPTTVPTATTVPPTAAPPPAPEDACVQGRVYLQGRSDHRGASVSVDGRTMATTERDGTFQFCTDPGDYTLTVAHACYLDRQVPLHLTPDQRLQIPYTALAGGDVNTDAVVNLFDLVRVGSDFRSAPPTDLAADCTADNVVNLFDLVLVGSNYAETGPQDWTYGKAARYALGRSAGLGTDGLAPSPERAFSPAVDSLTVDVTARGVEALYAVDLRLAFDPDRVRVVDAAARPGIQVQPGTAWGVDGEFFVAMNEVDGVAGTIAFSATRMRPASELPGDLVLATVTFEVLTDDPTGAYGLTSAMLLDRTSREIRSRWQGTDVYPLPMLDPAREIYLPVARRDLVR